MLLYDILEIIRLYINNFYINIIYICKLEIIILYIYNYYINIF